MIRKYFVIPFLSLINLLIRKKNRLLFIPHKNCGVDGYDVFNYTADNVLCLFHSIINDERFDKFDLLLVYYNKGKKSEYENYVRSYRRKGFVTLVDANNKIEMFKASMRFHICFIAESYRSFLFKTSKQKVITLGYFTPFKSDQNLFDKMSMKDIARRWKNINSSLNYEISTSELSSRILSTDSLLHYSKFRTLGFPRNDIFYKDNQSTREEIIRCINMPIDTIICYTPTYRDYERPDLSLYDESMCSRRTIFGNKSISDDLYLNEMLKKNNAVVIVKLHPWQEQSLLQDTSCDRIISYSELEKKMTISLYDVLAVSDCLITDYTSTAFDFLHANRPILYYFYDYELYKKNRGFSYNPIQNVCAGPISYSFKELIVELSKLLKKEDEYVYKRKIVHDFFNQEKDGLSCDRIKMFVLDNFLLK